MLPPKTITRTFSSASSASSVAGRVVLEDLLEGDADTLAGLFHDELLYSHTSGALDTKESYLEKVLSGFFDFRTVDVGPATATFVGDAAAVITPVHAEVELGGEPRTLHNSTLTVWVHDGGRWQIVASQPTALPAS